MTIADLGLLPHPGRPRDQQGRDEERSLHRDQHEQGWELHQDDGLGAGLPCNAR